MAAFLRPKPACTGPAYGDGSRREGPAPWGDRRDGGGVGGGEHVPVILARNASAWERGPGVGCPTGPRRRARAAIDGPPRDHYTSRHPDNTSQVRVRVHHRMIRLACCWWRLIRDQPAIDHFAHALARNLLAGVGSGWEVP